MVTILFKPIIPLHFGGPGEFSPAARGPAAVGRVMVFPQPTTILGLLAYITGGIRQGASGTLDEDYEVLCQRLAKVSELYVRGPYLVVKQGGDEAVHIVINSYLINVSDPSAENGLYKYIVLTFSKILGLGDSELSQYTSSLQEYKLNIVKFLGINLRRELKIPEEGLLYLAEFVDLKVLGDRKKRAIDSYIAVDLLGDIDKTLLSQYIGKPVRFGGESRVALLCGVEDRSTFTDLILAKYLDPEEECYLLVHVTPAILKLEQDQRYLTVDELSRHLFREFNIRLIGILGKFGKDVLSVICLGFNEVKKARRPLRLAVASGAISIVKDLDVKTLRKLCTQGIGDGMLDNRKIECRKVGFGTVIPVPLRRLLSSIPARVSESLQKAIKVLE